MRKRASKTKTCRVRCRKNRDKSTCCTSIRNQDPSSQINNNHINNQDAAVHACCPVWRRFTGAFWLPALLLKRTQDVQHLLWYLHACTQVYVSARIHMCAHTHTQHIFLKKEEKDRQQKDSMSISDFPINAHMCICILERVHMNTYTKI